MIQGLFLDLDDTILDFHRAEREALRRGLTELGMEAGDSVLDLYHTINQKQWKLLEEGKINRRQVIYGRFSILFECLGIESDSTELSDRYEEYLGDGVWFMPGAEETLRQLAGKYRLFVASNGTASVQHSRLTKTGLMPLFEKVFVSEELGVNKPDKGFFDYCFAQIGDLAPSETLMVGDSLSSDIRGGLWAGMHTCWVNPKGAEAPEGCRAEYEIPSLRELPALLEKLQRT